MTNPGSNVSILSCQAIVRGQDWKSDFWRCGATWMNGQDGWSGCWTRWVPRDLFATGTYTRLRLLILPRRSRTVARPSGCRIENRLDACRSERIEFCGKSIETSLDAADMNVRATLAAKLRCATLRMNGRCS